MLRMSGVITPPHLRLHSMHMYITLLSRRLKMCMSTGTHFCINTKKPAITMLKILGPLRNCALLLWVMLSAAVLVTTNTNCMTCTCMLPLRLISFVILGTVSIMCKYHWWWWWWCWCQAEGNYKGEYPTVWWQGYDYTNYIKNEKILNW